MTPLDVLVTRLDERGLLVSRRGDHITARCPAHDDHNASLSIGVGDDDRALVCCHAGCDAESIVRSLKLEPRDLFPAQETDPLHRHEARRQQQPRAKRFAVSDADARHFVEALAGNQGALERLRELRGWSPEAIRQLRLGLEGDRVVFAVRDAAGRLTGLMRYQPNPERRESNPKMMATPGSSRDLFPRPEDVSGDVLYVVEGEPDAVTGATLGLPTVAVPGASKWRDDWATRLSNGRSRVVVVADADAPGRDSAQRTAAAVARLCSDVRILDLDASRDDGFDIGDMLREAAGFGADGTASVRKVLMALARDTEPWTPHIEATGTSGGDAAADTDRESLTSHGLRITRACDVRIETVRYLVEDRIPVGALTLLAGDPGLGKSTWTSSVASGVTTGRYGPPGTVLLANAEDSIEHVIVPRLVAAGADLSRVEFFAAADPESVAQERAFTLPGDVPRLEAHAGRVGARLVVVDPLAAHLDDNVSSKSDHSVRRALSPLAAMAQRLGIAVLVVAHLNKASGMDAIYRVGGSIGLVGGARSVLLFTRDPDDPDGEDGSQRALGHAKSNWAKLAPTLLFRHEGARVERDGVSVDTNRLIPVGESTVPASALLAADRDDPPETKHERAVELLADKLGDGEPHRSKDIKAVARRDGIPTRTLQRALTEVGVDVEKKGYPAVTYWTLDVSRANALGATVAPSPWRDCENRVGIGDSDPYGPQSRQTREDGATEANGPSRDGLWHEGREAA